VVAQGLPLKEVHGWTCGCVAPDVGHDPRTCPTRRPVTHMIPTDPGFTLPPWRGAGKGEELRLPGPEVASTVAIPSRVGTLPSAATGLLSAAWRAGVPSALTYARGWTIRQVKIDQGDNGAARGSSDDRGRKGAGRKTRDVAARVESIAFRSRKFVAVWRRREIEEGSGVVGEDTGWERWGSAEAWVRAPGGGVRKVKITEAKQLLTGKGE